MGKWEDLKEVHVIIVCVDSQDSKPMGEQLVQDVKHLRAIPVFSLQKGVKNASSIKEAYVCVVATDAQTGLCVAELVWIFG